MTLGRFFEERIFKPLGMKDTAFYVPEEKWSRLATLYSPKQGGGIQRSTAPPQESFKKKPALLLGGAGLTSTMEDYSHFYAMLLNEGQFDGARILGRKSVELMRSDRTSPGRCRACPPCCPNGKVSGHCVRGELWSGKIARRRFGGSVPLGRRGGDDVLDRPEGTHVRDVPDTNSAVQLDGGGGVSADGV